MLKSNYEKRFVLVNPKEHEVINKNLCSLFQCILWVDGTIGRNFNNQFVIVGLLFNTIWLNGDCWENEYSTAGTGCGSGQYGSRLSPVDENWRINESQHDMTE